MVNLPALVMPAEFVALLKNPSAANGGAVPQMLRGAPGLNLVMERAFKEFDEHRMGLEKVSTALGWAHFRDRMASVYLFKALHGSFPDKTDMDLVEGIRLFETRFVDKSLTGSSRLFLLGLYLSFFNTYLSMRDDGGAEVKVPASVDRVLAMKQVRTDRPDWLVLICWHYDTFFGTDELLRLIQANTRWESLYERLTDAQRFTLVSNLLSYGASIQEEDPFLYERI